MDFETEFVRKFPGANYRCEAIYSDNDYHVYVPVFGDQVYVYTFVAGVINLVDTIPVDDCQCIWARDGIIYLLHLTQGIYAYRRVGNTHYLNGNIDDVGGGSYYFIYGDDAYIYVASSVGGGLRAYTHNANTGAFVFVASINAGVHQYREIKTDSTYIYACPAGGRFGVYTFNGVAFTELYNQPAIAGNYFGFARGFIHTCTAPYTNLIARQWDGAALNTIETFAITNQGAPNRIVAGLDYVFVTTADSGGYPSMVRIFRWDGATYEYITSIEAPQYGGANYSIDVYDPNNGYLFVSGGEFTGAAYIGASFGILRQVSEFVGDATVSNPRGKAPLRIRFNANIEAT